MEVTEQFGCRHIFDGFLASIFLLWLKCLLQAGLRSSGIRSAAEASAAICHLAMLVSEKTCSSTSLLSGKIKCMGFAILWAVRFVIWPICYNIISSPIKIGLEVLLAPWTFLRLFLTGLRSLWKGEKRAKCFLFLLLTNVPESGAHSIHRNDDFLQPRIRLMDPEDHHFLRVTRSGKTLSTRPVPFRKAITEEIADSSSPLSPRVKRSRPEAKLLGALGETVSFIDDLKMGPVNFDFLENVSRGYKGDSVLERLVNKMLAEEGCGKNKAPGLTDLETSVLSLIVFALDNFGPNHDLLEDALPSIAMVSSHIKCRHTKEVLSQIRGSKRGKRSADGANIRLHAPDIQRSSSSLYDIYKPKNIAKAGGTAVKSKLLPVFKGSGAKGLKGPSISNGHYAIIVIGGAIATPAIDAWSKYLKDPGPLDAVFKAKHQYNETILTYEDLEKEGYITDYGNKTVRIGLEENKRLKRAYREIVARSFASEFSELVDDDNQDHLHREKRGTLTGLTAFNLFLTWLFPSITMFGKSTGKGEGEGEKGEGEEGREKRAAPIIAIGALVAMIVNFSVYLTQAKNYGNQKKKLDELEFVLGELEKEISSLQDQIETELAKKTAAVEKAKRLAETKKMDRERQEYAKRAREAEKARNEALKLAQMSNNMLRDIQLQLKANKGRMRRDLRSDPNQARLESFKQSWGKSLSAEEARKEEARDDAFLGWKAPVWNAEYVLNQTRASVRAGSLRTERQDRVEDMSRWITQSVVDHLLGLVTLDFSTPMALSLALSALSKARTDGVFDPLIDAEDGDDLRKAQVETQRKAEVFISLFMTENGLVDENDAAADENNFVDYFAKLAPILAETKTEQEFRKVFYDVLPVVMKGETDLSAKVKRLVKSTLGSEDLGVLFKMFQDKDRFTANQLLNFIATGGNERQARSFGTGKTEEMVFDTYLVDREITSDLIVKSLRMALLDNDDLPAEDREKALSKMRALLRTDSDWSQQMTDAFRENDNELALSLFENKMRFISFQESGNLMVDGERGKRFFLALTLALPLFYWLTAGSVMVAANIQTIGETNEIMRRQVETKAKITEAKEKVVQLKTNLAQILFEKNAGKKIRAEQQGGAEGEERLKRGLSALMRMRLPKVKKLTKLRLPKAKIPMKLKTAVAKIRQKAPKSASFFLMVSAGAVAVPTFTEYFGKPAYNWLYEKLYCHYTVYLGSGKYCILNKRLDGVNSETGEFEIDQNHVVKLD